MAARFEGVLLQDNPSIVLAAIPGDWLLDHCTPAWRIKKPRNGFQRMVPEQRARLIALAVLNQGRTFPNAIVLATDSKGVVVSGCNVSIPTGTRFLVVDGQHRLYSQQYATRVATFACVVHVGLAIPEMARLFVEINDNQKRVPSSLRWDLVRLVRADGNEANVRASDLAESLNSEERSPLYQRIDMTGEQAQLTIKQGSLAPELATLVRSKKGAFQAEGFEGQLDILIKWFDAIRDRDPDDWKTGESPLHTARVLRALVQLLPRALRELEGSPRNMSAKEFFRLTKRIRLAELDNAVIRTMHGNAGIAAIRTTLERQMFGS